MTLYVASIVSFCLPHVVDVSALSISIALRAFVVVVLSICLLYVSLGSRVSLSNLGLMFMGNVVLFICSASCVLYSAWSGVRRVFSGLRMKLLFVSMYKFPIGMIECLILICRCYVLMLW